MFQGASQLTLDGKGRISIPSRHRDVLMAQCDGRLTLTRHPDGCLLVYPRPVWEARREKIAVLGMVLMPESSEFRQLCTPAKRAMVQAYLTGLCRDYHVRLIDAGCWIGDEHFADGHHLLPAGAHLFTERLWREHLQPLLN